MRFSLSTHRKRSIHMHVMACEIQAYQPLEDHAICRLRGRQEYQQTGRRATVGDHVQHRTKAGRLLKLARCKAIQSIEEAGDGVEEAASARVERHEVKAAYCEDDAEVANEVGCEEEDVFVCLLGCGILLLLSCYLWASGSSILDRPAVRLC